MLLLTNLLTLITTTSYEERIFTKELQVSSLIYRDITDGQSTKVDNGCLLISDNNDQIEYCFTTNGLVRTVNDQGYERLISDVTGAFTANQLIELQIDYNQQLITLPIWSNDE